LIASNATLAFQSALYCLRCRFTCLLSEAAILHLRDLLRIPGQGGRDSGIHPVSIPK
jgi:hypothetical protein